MITVNIITLSTCHNSTSSLRFHVIAVIIDSLRGNPVL